MSYLVMSNGIPDFDKGVISLWFRVPSETARKIVEQNIADAKAAEAAIPPNAVIPAAHVPRMSGIVPFLTFGPIYDGHDILYNETNDQTVEYDSYAWADGGWHFSFHKVLLSNVGPGPDYFAGDKEYPLNPSFIGLRCGYEQPGSGGSDTGTGGGGDGTSPPSTGSTDTTLPKDTVFTARLAIRLQMSDSKPGSGEWIFHAPRYEWHNFKQGTGYINDTPAPPNTTAWSYTFNTCFKDVYYPDGEWNTKQSQKDYTDLWIPAQGADYFGIGTGSSIAIDVTLDEWHHLLISFDFTESTRATGELANSHYEDCTDGGPNTNVEEKQPASLEDPCKMWIALDDTNYDKEYIQQRRPDQPGEPNDIASWNAWRTWNSLNGQITHAKTWAFTGAVQIADAQPAQPATYAYDSQKLPTDGNPFGIPCVPEQVGHEFHHVELAEFQLFQDVTLDTSKEELRRLFIDFTRNQDGDPDGSNVMLPVDPYKKATENDPRSGSIEGIGKVPELLLHGQSDWIIGRNTGSLGYDDNGFIDPAGQFAPTGTILPYPGPELVKAAGDGSGASPSIIKKQAAPRPYSGSAQRIGGIV